MNGNEAKKEQATKEFLGWLSAYSPELYAAVMEKVPEAAQAVATPPGMDGLMGMGYGFGQVPQPTTSPAPEPKAWWEKALDAAADLGTAYFGYQAQKDVLKVQQKRAEQGLPPIESAAYAPTIRHAVDIPPEFKQGAMGVGTLAVMGVGAVVLLMMANR